MCNIYIYIVYTICIIDYRYQLKCVTERVGKGDNANTTPCLLLLLQIFDKVVSLSHAACRMSCLSASSTADERNAYR